MIDSHSLKAGQDFKELPECYVIFITMNDVLGLNKAIYTIHRYIDETFEPFEDGSHIIYVNTSAQDDGTEIWKLIHDLRCAEAEEMFFPRLRSRVKFLKQDEKGAIEMDGVFEEFEKAILEREKESIALKLLALGKLTLEDIAKCSGLTLKKVQALASSL